MQDIAIEEISTNGKWQQYYMFISTDSVGSSKVNIYLYLGNQNNIAGSKVQDVTYTALEVKPNTVYDNHKVYYVKNKSLVVENGGKYYSADAFKTIGGWRKILFHIV